MGVSLPWLQYGKLTAKVKAWIFQTDPLPYSNFGMMNKGEWISELMDDWKPPEEKKWNPDDFMKFIRWAQWRIEETGAGILGFVTRNTYLDGITHWKMRESLMKTFSEIYVLDLHGSLRAKEKTPDGDPDKNVFDIQWGVSIGLFVKDAQSTGATKVRHADLWGERENKYDYLSKQNVGTTKWTKVKPTAPNYYFTPRDTEGEAEYLDAPPLFEIFKLKNSGLQTKKDSLTIHYSEAELKAVLKDMRTESVEALRKTYKLGKDGRDWAVSSAKEDVIESKGKIFSVEYRPFDTRFSYYTGKTKGFIAYPRADVTAHMLRPNLALISMRQIAGVPDLCEAFVTRNAVTDRSMASILGTPYMFPIYIYRKSIAKAAEDQREAFDASPYATADEERVPNFDAKFIFALEKRLKWKFEPFGSTALKNSFGSEDVLAYIYAITYSPTYRSRYSSFLAKDYPRIPFTSDQTLFRKLCLLGRELVALHLLESPKVHIFKTSFPVPGLTEVGRTYPNYYAPGSEIDPGKKPIKQGRVYINKNQYFEGVSEDVWTFQIGGYQICDRWLKDRQGRTLDGYGDLTRYQQIITAVSETLSLMEQIDGAISKWPIT